MSPAEFQKTINSLRLNNKEHWYTFTGYVEAQAGQPPAWIEVKGFNTWLQIFRVNGVDHSNAMDQTPTRFKAHLLSPFTPAGRVT